MIELSSRSTIISSSPTIRLVKIKDQLKAEGKSICDFGAGEPDFPTPENIKQAGIEAIRNNFTKYTSTSGTLELKKAIRTSYGAEQGYEPPDTEIIVSAGSKFGLFLLLQAVVDAGDEIIIPLPYWVSYPEIVRFCGGTPVYADHMRSNELFTMTAESYIKQVSEKTKVVIVNSPSNPTGKVMHREELAKLIDFFAPRQILVVVDDCYRQILYNEEEYPSPLAPQTEFRENIAVVSSLSKTYSMTGWRIGYTLAAPPIVAAMTRIQEHSTSNPCSISQKAAVEALRGEKTAVKKMVDEYRRRRDFFAARINDIGHIPFILPDGAFYFFADFSYYIRKKNLKDDQELAMDILSKLNIILVPGSAFGAPGYFRLSFATAMEEIKEGLRRIENYLKNG